jgi:hypothetical protein
MLKRFVISLLLLLPVAAFSQNALYIGFSVPYNTAQLPELKMLLDTISSRRDTSVNTPFTKIKGGFGFGFHFTRKIKMLYMDFGFARTVNSSVLSATLPEYNPLSADYDVRTVVFSPNIIIGFMPVKYVGVGVIGGAAFQNFKVRAGDDIIAKKVDGGFAPNFGGELLIQIPVSEQLMIQLRPYYKMTIGSADISGVSDYFLGSNGYSGNTKTKSTFIGVDISVGLWQEL